LRAIGGECAGALTILPVEQQPSVQYSYHSITDRELANLVTRRGQVYNWATKDRPRLSLAGAQDKCPILVRDGNYLRPQFLLNQVHEIATRLLINLDKTKIAFESQFGKYAALQRVEHVVSKQCRRVGDI
jgi:hypothetical protein